MNTGPRSEGTADTVPVPVVVPSRPEPSGPPTGTPAGAPAGEPATAPGGSGASDLTTYRVLTDGTAAPTASPPLPSRRGILVRLGLTALALVVAILVGTSFAASRLAEREAVNDVATTTNLLALSVVQPALTDGLLTGDETAYANLDRIVRANVLPAGIVRVKLWRPDGTIVYADEQRLVGQQFPLGTEQREALADPRTAAEVSDLDRSENEFERYGGKLLEVYRPVWTPSGTELLFEVYGDYAPVQARAFDLWRGLAGLLTSALLLLVVLLAPVIWRLLDRLEAARSQREDLLQRAVAASDSERRRIAADLHDGPVQDLVASSLAVSGVGAATRRRGDHALADRIDDAAMTVRSSIASLRSLLVDLYPARIADAGLAAALGDLARPLTSRGVAVTTTIDPELAGQLSGAEQQVVHRVARECLRNVVRHASARSVTLSLRDAPTYAARPGERATTLVVADDGVGFDLDDVVRREGHFGIRVLTDLAADIGGVLSVWSAPGEGTTWRLELRTGVGR
ncbi:sensor histidine kinase [Intrasporangium mesophilum]